MPRARGPTTKFRRLEAARIEGTAPSLLRAFGRAAKAARPDWSRDAFEFVEGMRWRGWPGRSEAAGFLVREVTSHGFDVCRARREGLSCKVKRDRSCESQSGGCHLERCSHRRRSACSAAQTGGRPAMICPHDGCGRRCPPIRSRNAQVWFSGNWTNSSNKTPRVRANLPRARSVSHQSLVSNRSLISSDNPRPSSAPAARPPAVTHHRKESRFDIPRWKSRQYLADEEPSLRHDPTSASCVPLFSAARTDKSTRFSRKCGWQRPRVLVIRRTDIGTAANSRSG